MEVIVVGIPVLGVAKLQMTQKNLKSGGWDLVFVKAAMLLQKMVT
jgi:hypothetical protein